MKEMPHIPGYQVIRKLGHGGMADVYLGIQESLDRKVAIKVMDPSLLRDDQFAQRFIKEAQTAAKLAHPHIITIHDVGETEGERSVYQYIVMEYLEESLSQRLRRCGCLSPLDAVDITIKIADALDYAHRQGFIHRDIKADNIMFRADGSVVLVDFGIARAVNSTTQLTRTGTSIGTPHYMSPEQCRGEKIDGRTDIYSLGVELFEMLTGEVPYKAESAAGIILKHLQDPIPKLPVELNVYQSLIDSMMSKDREKRPQSGYEVIELIESLQYGDTTVISRKTKSRRAIPISEAPTIQTSGKSSSFFKKTRTIREKWLLMAIIVIAAIGLVTGSIFLANRLTSDSGKIENQIASDNKTTDLSMMAQTDKNRLQGGINPGETKNYKENKTSVNKTDTSSALTQNGETKVGNRSGESNQVPGDANTSGNLEQGKMAMASITDLSPELRVQYNQRMQRLTIPIFKAAFQAGGQIVVDLMVTPDGAIHVQSLENKLDINPRFQEPRVLKIIHDHFSRVPLFPPKNKEDNPIQLQWRLEYNVGKIARTLVLLRNKTGNED